MGKSLAAETNNGTKTQNKALKYKYLPRRAVSLSNMVNIIIEQFLPEQHWKYLFLNFQMDPTPTELTLHTFPVTYRDAQEMW